MKSKRNREWLEGTNALTIWYYLYQRSKGDPVTYMCYATCKGEKKKKQRICTSQGLRSPLHRCQLDLIAVIRECCEQEHYCECESADRACSETKGIIQRAVTQVQFCVTLPYCITLTLLYSGFHQHGRWTATVHCYKSAFSLVILYTVTVALAPMHEYTD